MVFDQPLYPEYIKRIEFFLFWLNLTLFSVCGECAKIFQQFMRTLWAQYIKQVRWRIISEPRALREQNAVLIFCLPYRKIYLCILGYNKFDFFFRK
jgi:hypothetical protein